MWKSYCPQLTGGYIQMTNDTVGLCPNIPFFYIYNGFWYIPLVGLVVVVVVGGVLFVWWVLFVGLIARLFYF